MVVAGVDTSGGSWVMERSPVIWSFARLISH